VNTNMMHEVLAESQPGKLIFPEVVRRLLEAGVESYFCDLAKRQETFYACDGKTHVEKMTLPLSAVAEEFFSSGLIAGDPRGYATLVVQCRLPEDSRSKYCLKRTRRCPK
jgi:hypothetical protein